MCMTIDLFCTSGTEAAADGERLTPSVKLITRRGL
jgi:hypothetical protein